MPQSFKVGALYTSDGGVTHPIRISTADFTAQTTAGSTGAATQSNSARVSGSARRLGLRARFVTLTRSVTGGTGGGAVTRSYTTRLPILLLADYNALTKGAAVTVNGTAYTVASKTPESVK